jgi:hypothetical protein
MAVDYILIFVLINPALSYNVFLVYLGFLIPVFLLILILSKAKVSGFCINRGNVDEHNNWGDS